MNAPTPVSLPPNKTRIVATSGPASSSPDVLERMIQAGMNVARLNFSHGEVAVHRQNSLNLRAAAHATGRPLAIMADLSGPKMRIGRLADSSLAARLVGHVRRLWVTTTTAEIMADLDGRVIEAVRTTSVVGRHESIAQRV